MEQNKIKSRVMYLDIDDTLLVWNNDAFGFGAPRVAEFLKWANEHFEIRWLTMWCPSGQLHSEGANELAYRFNYKISPEFLQNIRNPNSFEHNKTEAIDFNETRPWVWVEDDGLFSSELNILNHHKKYDCYYETTVSKDPMALQYTWIKLARTFNLPVPSLDVEAKIEIPLSKRNTTPMQDIDNIISRFARDIELQNDTK